MKKYKIGIFGSNSEKNEKNDLLPENIAEDLSESLAKHNISLITGACSGIPYQIAKKSSDKGLYVTGYSPHLNMNEQKEYTPDDDMWIYKKIIYVPNSFPLKTNTKARFKYRNVISTANCDAGVIIAGRWGTLNEFTNLFDMGKIIGVLTGTGGIADQLQYLSKKIKKKSKSKIIFNPDPNTLVNKILKELIKK